MAVSAPYGCRYVPKSHGDVPAIRVEPVAIGDDYCAIFRRDGQPDEFLVDDRGRPRKFATASVALRHGRKALSAEQGPSVRAPHSDILGAGTWRAEKDRELAAERERVFGPSKATTIERGGRTVIVERRRLR